MGAGAPSLEVRPGPAEGSAAFCPQASHTEQELQRELDALRGQYQSQVLAGAELRTRLESLQGEVSASRGWGLPGAGPHLPSSPEVSPQNQMLQSRRQDLEAQTRGLRDEADAGRRRLQATHEELLVLRRERREHSLEVTRRAGVRGCVRWGTGHRLGASWELQKLGQDSLGITRRASGSLGRVLSKAAMLLESIGAWQLGDQGGH